MLRLLALEVRVGIGENEDSVVAVDYSLAASRVARQAGVTGRVQFAGTNVVADLEARFGVRVGTRVTRPLSRRHSHIRKSEWRGGLNGAGRGVACGDLVLRHQPMFDQQS